MWLLLVPTSFNMPTLKHFTCILRLISTLLKLAWKKRSTIILLTWCSLVPFSLGPGVSGNWPEWSWAWNVKWNEKRSWIFVYSGGATSRSSYNPGQKSLGLYCDILIFSIISRFPLKQCILFETFLQFSPRPPPPIQSWNSEKILDTRVQHCLWGEGRGWTCVNRKMPQKRKSVPRLLSMIVVCRHSIKLMSNK